MNVPELLNSLGTAFEEAQQYATARDEANRVASEAQKAYEVAAQKLSSLQASLNAVLGQTSNPRFRTG